MEASTSSRRIRLKLRGGGALSGRRGGIIIAVVAAVFAGALIYVFVQRYKSSATPSVPPIASVIVAKQYIPRGTPFSEVEANNGTERTTVKTSSAVAGAITDPSEVSGQAVAATNIAPGQELSSADFTVATVSIAQYLIGKNRALQIPIDATHGMTGYVTAGDHVDLATNIGALAGTRSHPGLGILATNVLVLAVPAGSLVLQVPQQVAQQVAFASDNGKIWVFMRPPSITK
jgi:Flp pilus assembly protein CpaB